MTNSRHYHNLFRDLAIIFFSLVVAAYLWQTNLTVNIISFFPQVKLLGAFIAGLFFTSAFTILPAGVALAEIAQSNSLILVSFIGAAGAVVGDMIIFRFVRDHLLDDFIYLIQQNSHKSRIKHIFRSRIMRFSLALLGGIMIASPLPDELGLTLLGMSKVKTNLFIPISFVFNFMGIFIVGLAAKYFVVL